MSVSETAPATPALPGRQSHLAPALETCRAVRVTTVVGMEELHWSRRPRLDAPILIMAFSGWNDAGDAASGALRYLSLAWETRPFATIDPEEFFDFTESRPEVKLRKGGARTIQWPSNVFEAGIARPEGSRTGRHVVLLNGTEPQLRWRTFSEQVLAVVKELKVSLVLSIGALLADVPHRRPVRVSASAADPGLARRLGLRQNRYQGPTGIVGVLHESLAAHQVPSISLWASVPHYVAQAPSPKATQALVQQIGGLVGVPVDTSDLVLAVEEYERKIDELVAADDDAAAYVAHLEAEEEDPEEADHGQLIVDPADISADRLAEEAEEYLRDQS